MLSKKTKLLLLIVGLQVLFFLSWSFSEHSKLSDPEANEILVKTEPVDPRDLISGNYFILNYKFSRSWNFKKKQNLYKKKRGLTVYAVLEKKGKYYEPNYISFAKISKVAKNQVIIKGKIKYGSRLEYGIEKYFINENTKEPNSRNDKIEVLLTIDKNFSARIKKLYVNDEEFDQSKYQKNKK